MRVSIVTTLYNYRKYIGECIESFLDQDFSDSEMIIVDDCSTDDPYEVIRKYESNRVRYVRLPEKANYSVAKNVGIKNTRAEIIVMLDADDMFTKNGISVRYDKLMEGHDFVHGPCLILRNGRICEGTVWKKYLKSGSFRHVHAQTVMLRKGIHRKIGLYDEELWSSSDYEMWGRIFAHNFKIGWVDKAVCIYRRHSLQMSTSERKISNLKEIVSACNRKIKKRKTDLSGLEMLV